ncbi:MAG: phosphoglucosamine mutase [Lentimicrobiaceae bacterium]|nr:phosphoglucosamine mutase [Lentimicrobiaceae bacterium]MCB9024532.1 phosphoglucosamine mutase [Lentimicrobiaceae bacterium]MCO5266354.1 phosphoglucosamine mutase [Lentimicrobium sp.]
MTLIKSISGIRGTIGGHPGEGLSPLDIVKYTSAYAHLLGNNGEKRLKVVVGRDARVSGPMVNSLVCGTLSGMGVDVVDIGLSTTPTVEMAVIDLEADGGIILTASHNPWQWNALKLLNRDGEFISAELGEQLLNVAASGNYTYAPVDKLGTITQDDSQIRKHIEKILALPQVNSFAIKMARFRVAIDCVNSTGGIAIPLLLRSLGVELIDELYCEPNGLFPHNPEPLPENLQEISKLVVKSKAHVGFVVDPDVDRLAIICEDGEMFGEEYTLVAVSDYVLSATPGNTVSNMSSTRALRDVTEKHGGRHYASAVGEVNVVEKMKEVDAIIGGEGNGGVILPQLHYGRDALVGIALFLTHLAQSGKRTSALRSTFPEYFISKNKIQLSAEMDVDKILESITAKYKKQPVNTEDGVKIEFGHEWVHLRKSNTEPIIRIYSESDSMVKADVLARKIIDDIKEVIRG